MLVQQYNKRVAQVKQDSDRVGGNQTRTRRKLLQRQYLAISVEATSNQALRALLKCAGLSPKLYFTQALMKLKKDGVLPPDAADDSGSEQLSQD